MYWGGARFQAHLPAPPYQCAIISLYNDANDGSFLEVQAFSIGSDANLSTDVDFQQGTFGSMVVQGWPVQLDRPTRAGQIWLDVFSAGAPNLPGPITNPISSLPSVYTSETQLSGQCFWRVPAGFSLRFANSLNFSNIAVALWWFVTAAG
jgi:hypothetical protein